MLGRIMYFALWVLLWLLRRLWWRWSISGLEHLPPRGQGVILAINHLDWTDIPIIGASLPLSHQPSWVAKIELFRRNRLLAWWLHQMGVIPIKRGHPDKGALSAAEQALERGALVIFFVEGHRSETGGLIQGRGGAIYLAARSGCPIIPVALWGTQVGLRGACLRKPLNVRLGQPYALEVEGPRLSQQQVHELTTQLMYKIAALLPEQYRGIYAKSETSNPET